MGNLACCCKRDKTENGMEDALPNQCAKIPGATPNNEESPENSFNSQGFGGGGVAATPSQNRIQKGKDTITNTEQPVILMNEFTTFREETNIMSSNPHPQQKPVIAPKNPTISNELKSTEEMQIHNRQETTGMKSLANEKMSTQGSETMSIGIPKNQVSMVTITSDAKKCNKIESNVYIRIYVDYFDALSKRLDDFGSIFRPFLEISLQSESESLIKIPSVVESDDLDKSLNVSIMSDASLNTSQILRTNTSQIGKEKVYSFKTSKIWEIPAQHYYSDIEINIINELTGYANLTSKKTQSASQTQTTSPRPPEVMIGSIAIPINLLDKYLKGKKENTFEGHLEIKQRNCVTIGYLKVSLTLSDKSLSAQDEFYQKINRSKSIFTVDLEDNFETSSMQSIKQQANIFDIGLLEYQDLNPYTLRSLLNEEDDEETFLLAAQNVPRFVECLPNRKSSYSHSLIYKLFKDAIMNHNVVTLYQILALFARLSTKDDYTMIDEFFKLFSENDRKAFIPDIYMMGNDNPYIFSLLLCFSYNYMRYYKHNKHPIIRNSKSLDNHKVFEISLNILIAMIAKMKRFDYPSEWRNKIRECIVWCLSIFHELVSEANPIDSKNSAEDIFLQKKKDYSNMYVNCTEVISERAKILKTSELYLQDSEIMNIMYKIFRKAILTLTNYQNKHLEQSLSQNCKQIALELKVLVIEEGANLNFMKVVMNMYQHYPELHLNILMILFNLTNLDPKVYLKTLFTAAKLLGLQLFKDGFDIFRGRLRGTFKFINNLHLSVLANLSEIANAVPDESQTSLIRLIANDLKAFYVVPANYKNRYEDFRQRKKCEIEIQEIITRIGINITKSHALCEDLMSTYFFDDIIEYLIIIGVGENNEEDNNSCHSNNSNNQQSDFITTLRLKRGKKNTTEEIAKLTQSIVENSVIIVFNVMNGSNDLSDSFSSKLAEHEFASAEDLYSLIDDCVGLLKKHHANLGNLPEYINDLKNLFD